MNTYQPKPKMIMLSDIPTKRSTLASAFARATPRRELTSYSARCLHRHHMIWSLTLASVIFLSCYIKPAMATVGVPVVCSGRTIFNDLRELSSLRNCTIIEGNLELFVITKDVQWDDFVLSDLREITGMLVLYRVHRLQSLGHLLPNLAVIRGDDTLMGYSLVIYQAIHLERLELTHLTTIQNGSVRIQDNHNLCYATTVKWRRIILSNKEEMIERNGDTCQDCPSSCGDVGCWGSDQCQLVAPSICPHSAYNETTCCHRSCLGGCSSPDSSRSCFACVRLLSSNICVDKCYKNESKYQNRRCLSETECRAADPKNKILRENSTRGYEAECVRQCPRKMTVNVTSAVCEPCKDGDVCEKICPGQHVNTIDEARAFEGCTVINGTLQLSINGGKDITTDLTTYFQDIQEVTEYIHVFHSAFLSLEFFRSLRVIEGRNLENGKYALYVRDNKVLEDIWDWSNKRSLTIKKGAVFFHSNPKLCHDKIEQLLNYSVGVNRNESAIKLNGGNAACRVDDLKAEVEAVPNRLGELNVTWKPVSIPDDRALLGYNVYYRTTKFRNLTIYNNRDACNDPWKMKYKDANHTIERMWLLLENLTPNTLYAIYVETDIVLSTDTGARSIILYCVTEPFNPGHPQNVHLRSYDNTDLEVSWEPPLDPNGEIDVYWLHATMVVPRFTFNEGTKFCDKPLSHWQAMYTTSVEEETVEDKSHRPQPPWKKDCCPCKSLPQDFEETRREKIASKLFEDALYHLVYSNITIAVNRRHRRSTSFEFHKDDVYEEAPRLGLNKPNEIVLTPDKGLKLNEELQNGTETVVLVSANKRKYQFKNVEPFKQYKVEVVACQGLRDCPEKTGGKCRLCSRKPYLQRRIYIKGKEEADNVLEESIDNDQNQVSFMLPENPTAPLVGFLVRSFNHDTQTQLDCVFRRASDCPNNTCIVDLTAAEPKTNVSITTVTLNRIGQNVSLAYPVKSEDGRVWVYIMVPAFIVLGVITSVMVWLRKQNVPRPPHDEADNSQYFPVSPEVYDKIEKKYIHLPNNLKIYEEILGEGNFGVVKRGVLHLMKSKGSDQNNDEYEEVPVAVKLLTNCLPNRANKSILDEAALMLKFKCFHLVRLYGVVPSKGKLPTCLVMELMEGKDLKHYLETLPVTGGSIFSVLTQEKVLAMATQIADGMAYLATNNIVHRDLAARNCLLDEKMNVKISDFGMTRIADNEIYWIKNLNNLPFRWMAPESFKGSYCTSKSDVWSYGVVIWEILTGGARPYANIRVEEVPMYVYKGLTLKYSLPDDTPLYLVELLVKCWKFDKEERPNFLQIVSVLEPHTSTEFQRQFRGNSFYHSPECTEIEHHL